MRVIDQDGEQLGIRPLPEALNLARDRDLDLVEVADKAKPPVVRIMDYRKFKYEEQQRVKESRKKSTNIVVKEMKYRPKIGVGDFDTKTRKVTEFLEEGTRSRSRSCSVVERCSTPNWAGRFWTASPSR